MVGEMIFFLIRFVRYAHVLVVTLGNSEQQVDLTLDTLKSNLLNEKAR
mgnify:CR=1 FL=1